MLGPADWDGMRRVQLIPSLALAVLTAMPTTATAATAGDESSAEMAIWVLEEVALLEQAGAFLDDPTADAVRSFVDEEFEDRAELLSVLREVDGANAEDLAELTASDIAVAAATREVLGSLPEGDWERLERGEQSFLAPTPWITAADQLLLRAGAPAPGRDAATGAVVVEVLEALPVGGVAGLGLIPGTLSGLVTAPGSVEGEGAADTTTAVEGDPTAGDDAATDPGEPGDGRPGTATTTSTAATTDATDGGRSDTTPTRDGPSPMMVSWLGTLALVAVAGAAVALRRRREAARATYEMPFSLPPADEYLGGGDGEDGPVEVWRAVVLDGVGAEGEADDGDAEDADPEAPEGQVPPPPPRGGRGVVPARSPSPSRPSPPSPPPSAATAGTWPASGDDGLRGPPPPPWEVDEPPPAPAAVLAEETRDRSHGVRTVGPAPATTVHGRGTGTADVVIEAGRRMTAALDGASVRRIAVETAATLLPGGEAAFVDGRSTTARWARAAPAWGTPDPTDERSIVRVLETAQSGWSAATDPAAGDVVVAAAPVLVDGTVVGAIVVGRAGDDGFSSDEIATLDLLTPVVGSALGAAEAHLRAVAAAELDELTQLRNRRRLDADLAALDDTAEVAFAMVDVDHFKHLNDTRGHAAGDAALQLVATAIAGAVRPVDAVYRYGGEEFSVVLHGCDPATAVDVMDEVRRAVAALDVPAADDQPLGRVTVSVGVATTAAGPLDGLVERADGALYEAKEAGRDRVVLADSVQLPRTRTDVDGPDVTGAAGSEDAAAPAEDDAAGSAAPTAVPSDAIDGGRVDGDG